MTTPNAEPGQEPGNASTSGQEPTTTPTSGQEPKSQSDLEKIIADLRKENAASRVKAKELDDLRQKIENDKLSETERLQKQVADLQKAHDTAIAEAASLKLNAQVATQAAKLGFADPEDAIKFLGKLGEGADVEALLKDLLKNKPYLAGQQQQRASSGGATNPARSQTQASTINEEYVRNLLSTPQGQKTYASMSQAQKAEVQDIIARMNKGRGALI